MTEKPNSVCKHCHCGEGHLIHYAGKGFMNAHKFEPVAESAEPSASPSEPDDFGNIGEDQDEPVSAEPIAEGPETLHCQECKEVIHFDGRQWLHDDGTSTYPTCTRPRTAAPQPVAGEGPLKEYPTINSHWEHLFTIKKVNMNCFKVYFCGAYLNAVGSQKRGTGLIRQITNAIKKHLRGQYYEGYKAGKEFALADETL